MRFILRRVDAGAPSGKGALALVRRSALLVDAVPGMLLIRASPKAAARIAAQ